MHTFEVAHVRVDGTDLILFPVSEGFARRSSAEQLAAAATLQRYATRAGLAGTAVPVWRGRSGRLTFLARPSLHGVIGTMTWEDVAASLNVRLTVGRPAAAARPERVSADAA